MRCRGACGCVLIAYDGVRNRLQSCEGDGLVEHAAGRRRRAVQSEAEGSGTVVGRLQQVVKLAQLVFAGVLLDNAAAPIVGAGIAERSEDTFQGCRLEGELDRIDGGFDLPPP